MNRIHLATAEEEEPAVVPRAESPKPAEKTLGSPFLGLRRLFGREH